MPPLGFLVLALAVCGACATPPTDPEGTLERVENGTLRVGITHNEPWTIVGPDGPSGVEVELVEEFAATVDARIEWFDGSEEHLFGALHLGQLDLVIGGFGAENSNSAEAALTHPYVSTQSIVAVPAGEKVPDDISGLEVAVEAGTEEAGVLEE